MSRIERICPECGASNSLHNARCARCRAPLTPSPGAPPPPPLSLSRRSMARLAWRATRALSRMGYRLARQGIEKGVERVLHGEKSVKHETVEGEYALSEWRTGTRSSGTAGDQGQRIHWSGKP